MKKEELAALLNGREYREEMTDAEEAESTFDGLLVVFGASDDLMEFRGAICDEVGAWNGTIAMVHPGGVLPAWDCFNEKDDEEACEKYFANKKRAISIAADWDRNGYSWVISTTVPFAAFDILEDGEKYCRGIVIDMTEAFPPAVHPAAMTRPEAPPGMTPEHMAAMVEDMKGAQ